MDLYYQQFLFLLMFGIQIQIQRAIAKKKLLLFFNQTLLYDHSFESSRRDDSNEWSHHRVWLRYKKVIVKNSLNNWNPIFCVFVPTHLASIRLTDSLELHQSIYLWTMVHRCTTGQKSWQLSATQSFEVLDACRDLKYKYIACLEQLSVMFCNWVEHMLI